MRLLKIFLMFPPPFSPAWNYLRKDILSSVHQDGLLGSGKGIPYNCFSAVHELREAHPSGQYYV